MEHRHLNENFKRIAEELIENEPELKYIKDSRVKIAYLESDQAKKATGDKLVHGECEKIAAKYKWGIPADFTITLYAKNNISMDEEQLKVLMFHELLHIGIEPGPDGDETYSVNPHDLEDFKLIIDKFGTNWATEKRKIENG